MICPECGNQCDVKKVTDADTSEFWGNVSTSVSIYFVTTCCDYEIQEDDSFEL